MLNIRYRSGVVGETARVVHAALPNLEGQLVSLCGRIFDPELVEASHGMPCMRCIRITATSGDGAEPIEHSPHVIENRSER